MARYNRVKIGDQYLTVDGLEAGRPCKVIVTGLDDLHLDFLGSTQKAASGKPYTFLLENLGEGVDISIGVDPSVVTTFEAIRDLINDALGNGTTINITIEGDTGDFDLECVPLFNGETKPITFSGRFANGRIYEVVYNFTVESINTP